MFSDSFQIVVCKYFMRKRVSYLSFMFSFRFSAIWFVSLFGCLLFCTVASRSYLGCYDVFLFRSSFCFRRRNFHIVMILDGCDRRFLLHSFRLLPVGLILVCGTASANTESHIQPKVHRLVKVDELEFEFTTKVSN